MARAARTWPHTYKGSLLSETEKNDCVIRAITETFDVPYDLAHKIAEDKFERKPKRGTQNFIKKITKLSEENFTIGKYKIGILSDDELEYYGSKNEIGIFVNNPSEGCRMTVGMFARKNPIGRFLIIVNGHAFSMVDGRIIGNPDDGKRVKSRLHSVIVANEI